MDDTVAMRITWVHFFCLLCIRVNLTGNPIKPAVQIFSVCEILREGNDEKKTVIFFGWDTSDWKKKYRSEYEVKWEIPVLRPDSTVDSFSEIKSNLLNFAIISKWSKRNAMQLNVNEQRTSRNEIRSEIATEYDLNAHMGWHSISV